MREISNRTLSLPATSSKDALTDVMRAGAQRMLTQAIEAEVAQWIDAHAALTGQQGHRQVVRNGHLPERTIVTGVGPIEVRQPRVLDRAYQKTSFFAADSPLAHHIFLDPSGTHPLSQDLKPLRLEKGSRFGVEIAHIQFDLGNTFFSSEFLQVYYESPSDSTPPAPWSYNDFVNVDELTWLKKRNTRRASNGCGAIPLHFGFEFSHPQVLIC